MYFLGGWEFFGRSLVRLWFLVGLLHETKREGTREGNLNFRYCLVDGASAYCLAVRGKDV